MVVLIGQGTMYVTLGFRTDYRTSQIPFPGIQSGNQLRAEFGTSRDIENISFGEAKAAIYGDRQWSGARK